MEYPKMNGDLISLINECLKPTGKKLIVVDIDDKEEERLLNCPFCSEIPVMVEFHGNFYIECESELHISKTFNYNTKKEAITAWNTRAYRTNIVTE